MNVGDDFRRVRRPGWRGDMEVSYCNAHRDQCQLSSHLRSVYRARKEGPSMTEARRRAPSAEKGDMTDSPSRRFSVNTSKEGLLTTMGCTVCRSVDRQLVRRDSKKRRVLIQRPTCDSPDTDRILRLSRPPPHRRANGTDDNPSAQVGKWPIRRLGSIRPSHRPVVGHLRQNSVPSSEVRVGVSEEALRRQK